ncbi:putative endonuclease 8 2 [Kineosporia sp. NBRC 101677]|uniref:DNA-formamidopyrimidine glycosylase family protein n=1 Tax=Kineosporia sp. NBRC 101677 TaxID=3032197 RepID=UPI0024A4B84D|nr:DNA-formamidopyrimidine glycosylase family protein [Kineosporia sp. NBRC 101677]GLY14973.1 putative endonuclease 8 2 [Kineosporia sp. NBRC 101677]
MPEGDTVYLLARRLNARLRGQVVRRSDLRVPQHATADLSGATLVKTDTHGKHLLTRFTVPDQPGITLHTHLRMDGSWTVLNPGKQLPRRLAPDIRVLLDFQNGLSAVGLKLPVVELIPTDREKDVVGHLGPDPLRADWDADEAVRRLVGDHERPLAATLLDQTRMAGLGNLWVNELCFLRGHSPWTPVREVDIPALVTLAVRLLRFSVNTPGAAQVTTGNTRPGQQHWVAGRAGQPCLRCRTRIQVVAEVSGDPERRRTWWCPHCQPGPPPPA